MRIELDPKGITFQPADDVDAEALVEIARIATAAGHSPRLGESLRVDLRPGEALGPAWSGIYLRVLEEGIEVVRSIVYCDDRRNLPALCNKRTPF